MSIKIIQDPSLSFLSNFTKRFLKEYPKVQELFSLTNEPETAFIEPFPDNILDKIFAEQGEELDIKEFNEMWGSGYRDTLEGFSLEKKLGGGSFGSVYSLKRDGFTDRVIKLSDITEEKNLIEYLHERDNTEYLSDNESNISVELFVSKIYTHGEKRIGVLITERVDGTLLEVFSSIPDLDTIYFDEIIYNIGILLLKLCKVKMIHADPNFGNIGLIRAPDGDYVMKFLDWGHSRQQKCYPCLEIAQLARSTVLRYSHRDFSRPNMVRLISGLRLLHEIFACDGIFPNSLENFWTETLVEHYDIAGV